MSKTVRRLTAIGLLFVAGLSLVNLTGCRGETNEDGAQIELGNPD